MSLRSALALSLLAYASAAPAQEEIYRYRAGEEPRWISPGNPTGAKGAGGGENRGAKGNAFETIPIGAAVAYFYLGRAEGVLPPIAPAAERMAAIRKPAEKK
jgi:hypothetical protein